MYDEAGTTHFIVVNENLPENDILGDFTLLGLAQKNVSGAVSIVSQMWSDYYDSVLSFRHSAPDDLENIGSYKGNPIIIVKKSIIDGMNIL